MNTIISDLLDKVHQLKQEVKILNEENKSLKKWLVKQNYIVEKNNFKSESSKESFVQKGNPLNL